MFYRQGESKTQEGINLSQVREQYRHTWELHLDSLVPKAGHFQIKPWLLYHLAVAYKVRNHGFPVLLRIMWSRLTAKFLIPKPFSAVVCFSNYHSKFVFLS